MRNWGKNRHVLLLLLHKYFFIISGWKRAPDRSFGRSRCLYSEWEHEWDKVRSMRRKRERLKVRVEKSIECGCRSESIRQKEIKRHTCASFRPTLFGIDLARAKWLQNPKPKRKITKDALGAVFRSKFGSIDVFLEATPHWKITDAAENS